MVFLILFSDFLLLWTVGVFCTPEDEDGRNQKFRVSTNLNVVDLPLTTLHDLYSSWSPWTRCSTRCRQLRIRHCLVASECGANMLREERTCFRDRCRESPVGHWRGEKKRKRKNDNDAEAKVENAQSREDGDFHVLYHLQPFVYSDWSDWSTCTNGCRTRRSRSCQIPDICGDNIIHEDALCYIEGSPCERLHKKKRRRKKSSKSPGNNKKGSHPLSGVKCGIAPKKQGLRSFLRIIGGREAVKGSWPWQVTILNKYREPFCGGTLLNDRWVLTAAHCVRRRLLVRVGEHDLMTDEGTEQESRVYHSFIHHEYDPDTVNNDIALLLLRNPFDLDEHVRPACLPTSNDLLPVHARATIIGWGKRRNSAVFGTDVLHQAEVPVVDADACREVYDNYHISDNMLCAGYKRGRVDSCAGDSGGPLLYKHEDRWVVHGITSFGEGCGQKGKFGIYAKVGKFVKWIKKTIARHS